MRKQTQRSKWCIQSHRQTMIWIQVWLSLKPELSNLYSIEEEPQFPKESTKTGEKRECINIPRDHPGFCMLIRNIEKAAAKVLHILQPPFSCQEVAIYIHSYRRRGSLNKAAGVFSEGAVTFIRVHTEAPAPAGSEPSPPSWAPPTSIPSFLQNDY